MRGFPDFWAEILNLRHLDDGILVEGLITGTHDGEWVGIPPTGRRISIRVVSIFEFDEDRLMCEKACAVCFWCSTGLSRGQKILERTAHSIDAARRRGRFTDVLRDQSERRPLPELLSHPVSIRDAFARGLCLHAHTAGKLFRRCIGGKGEQRQQAGELCCRLESTTAREFHRAAHRAENLSGQRGIRAFPLMRIERKQSAFVMIGGGLPRFGGESEARRHEAALFLVFPRDL